MFFIWDFFLFIFLKIRVIKFVGAKLNKYKKIEEHIMSTISMTQDMPDHPRIMELIKYFEDTTGLINRKKLQALDGKNN